MVRPEEALESFPNEGKHESVPRVKIQITTDLSRVQWQRRCPVSSGDVGLQDSELCRSLGCVFHREDTIPGIDFHSCCSWISLGAQIAINASAVPRVLGRSVLLAGPTGSRHSSAPRETSPAERLHPPQ